MPLLVWMLTSPKHRRRNSQSQSQRSHHRLPNVQNQSSSKEVAPPMSWADIGAWDAPPSQPPPSAVAAAAHPEEDESPATQALAGQRVTGMDVEPDASDMHHHHPTAPSNGSRLLHEEQGANAGASHAQAQVAAAAAEAVAAAAQQAREDRRSALADESPPPAAAAAAAPMSSTAYLQYLQQVVADVPAVPSPPGL
eukprot:COSAG01_NODE_3796_length_5688_cov_4.251208_1_plen_196_part_00